ncbi:MAG: YihY/virulence factor BrkB family protein [Odoribacteraceae bacterium]|jgi:membrane protein|nr:YihY/virulence factor BrkB family protein [Odoribacteraceae bacterium]
MKTKHARPPRPLSRLFSLEHHYRVLRRDRHTPRDTARETLSAIIVSAHRFTGDGCGIAASALTYYTILSFVPLVALLFAIAKGFGFRVDLENLLRSRFEENTPLLEQLLEIANRAIENTRGGIITGIGIFILLWAVIRVLNGAETAMNRVWRIKRGRGPRRLLADYLSLLFIAPLLLILGSGLNVFLTTSLETYLPALAPWIERLFSLLPYLLVWALFLLLYMYMPATPVRFRHAIRGAIIAGTLYQVIQWIYIRFQVGVSSYNAIYGSLAALPLLIVWVQLSWSVLLWGAELCYISRYRHFMYRDETRGDEPWLALIETAMKITRLIVERYTREGPVTLLEIAKQLEMNAGRIQLVLDEMVERGALVATTNGENTRYLPARDYRHLSEADLFIVLSRVEESKDEHWKERFTSAIRAGFTEPWDEPSPPANKHENIQA